MRRFFLALVFLLGLSLAAQAQSAKHSPTSYTPFQVGYSSLTAGATTYGIPGWNGNQANVNNQAIWPLTGVFTSVRINCGTAVEAAHVYTVTLYVGPSGANPASTSLAAVVSSGNQGSGTGAVAVNAGDSVMWRLDNGNASAATGLCGASAVFRTNAGS